MQCDTPQHHLSLVQDGSHLSFNVMLSNHSDFDGGGTFYDALDTVLKPTQVLAAC